MASRPTGGALWTPYVDRELARATAYRKAADWVAATSRTAYPSFGAFYVAGVIALTLVDRARSTPELVLLAASPFLLWLGPVAGWSLGRRLSVMRAPLLAAIDEVDALLQQAETTTTSILDDLDDLDDLQPEPARPTGPAGPSVLRRRLRHWLG